jgi:hypothetical protein
MQDLLPVKELRELATAQEETDHGHARTIVSSKLHDWFGAKWQLRVHSPDD